MWDGCLDLMFGAPCVGCSSEKSGVCSHGCVYISFLGGFEVVYGVSVHVEWRDLAA